MKVTEVSHIFKKDDPQKLKNYRPFSVLLVATKVFERLLHKQMSLHVEEYLSPYLCCYRKELSTQEVLLSLSERLKNVLDKKGYGGAVLMDISKAFDTLNHDLLTAKLHADCFSEEPLQLIKSYLTNRWQMTKVNANFSSWAELLLGGPQWFVLRPLLFNKNINRIFYVTKLTNVCNYADDTTFYACDSDICNLIKRLEHD